VTPAKSLLVAIVAVVLLIAARPTAGVEQYPRGLMSATPTAGSNRSCAIETRPINFGYYDTLAGTDVTAIGQVIYTCSGGGGGNPGGPGGGNPGGPGTTASNPDKQSIRIEMAQGHTNSFAPRGMTGPESFVSGTFLSYNIYLDATHRQVWGTGEGPTLAYVDAHPPNGTPVIVPAFGRIFGGQDVTWGPYTDTVPVRILF
jgi:spore coat protein U-like protein